MATDDWQAVGMDQDDATSIVSWLEAKGLGKYVEKIIEETDAEQIDDLKLLDASMIEDVIKSADLKLVSAQKLRLALAELRGTATSPKAASLQSPISSGYPTSA